MSDNNLSGKTYSELVQLRQAAYDKMDEEVDKIEAAISDLTQNQVLELVKQNRWTVDKYSPDRLRADHILNDESIELYEMLSTDNPKLVGKIYRFGDVAVYSKNNIVYMEGMSDNQGPSIEAFNIQSEFASLVKFVNDNKINISFRILETEVVDAKSRLNQAMEYWSRYSAMIEKQ